MSDFQLTKILLMETTRLGKDALHVYVGLIVMLTVAIALRRSLGDWRPILAVALAAFAGEIWDMVDTYSYGVTPKFEANAKDILNTMFWPIVLFALARFTSVLKR